MNVKGLLIKGIATTVIAGALISIVKDIQKKKEQYNDCKRMAELVREVMEISNAVEEFNSNHEEDERIEIEGSVYEQMMNDRITELRKIGAKYKIISEK